MRKFLLLLLPLAVLAAGCLSPEQQLVGKWKGKVEMAQSLKSSMGPMAGFSNLIEPQLDLRPDKTFRLAISLAPIEGTWKLDNDTLILTPKSFMGMPAEEVKAKAQKELDHARSDSSSIPIPLPTQVPGVSEMKAEVDQKDSTITLDPAAGTFIAGFGKIVFKKV